MSVDSRYIRIATKFWQDEKVRELSDDGKLLYLYVLTSPHSNMAGYYVLPKPYVAYDLNWLPERLDKAFRELFRKGLIKYCERSAVILIPNFLKYNPMQNKNQAKGAARRVAELPENTLTRDFETVLKRFAKPFVEPFAEGFANTDTDTETDTDADTESEARAPADDDDDEESFLKDLGRAFESAFGYPPNSTQTEMLLSFVKDGVREEVVLEALKRSAENGAQNPSYTKSILQSWLSKKAYTLDDVKTLDKLRSPPRSRGGPVTRDEFTYKETRQDRSQFTFLREDGHEKGGRK